MESTAYEQKMRPSHEKSRFLGFGEHSVEVLVCDCALRSRFKSEAQSGNSPHINRSAAWLTDESSNERATRDRF